jgi:hypothetical protein
MTSREDESFDCIAFKRRVQAEIRHETAGMTREEEISYYHIRVAAGPFGNWWGTLEKEPQVVREKADGRGDDVESG